MNTRHFSENSILELDPVVGQFYGYFGLDTAFVPLPPGRQEPANDKWREMTLERARSDAHLNLFWNLDIAVLCGPVSLNLCGVCFHDEAALLNFRELNPELKTLGSEHAGRVWLWFRIAGFIPQTQRPPDCLWQAGGLVKVFDRRAGGEKHQVLDPAAPLLIAFESIHWNPETAEVLRPQIIAAEFGQPFETVKGQRRPNVMFFAQYLALEGNLLYVPVHQSFYHYNMEGRRMKNLGVEEVQHLALKFLVRLDKAKDYKGAASLAQPDGLKKMLSALRVVAVGKLPPEEDVMAQFLNRCVVPDAHASATTEELFIAFKGLCDVGNLAAMPQAIFERIIGPLLREKFGVCHSHSIVRNGGYRRGYNYIRVDPASSGMSGVGGEEITQPVSAH